MSDVREPLPDADLLEFLGSVDEVIDEAEGEDFSDFLASTDLEKVAKAPAKPAKPVDGDKK